MGKSFLYQRYVAFGSVFVRPQCKKQIPGSGICFIGAGDRTRTGTPSLAADFESATSTISSHRQVCYFHFLRFASAGVRLRCPKFYARFRLQNFDRCPSLGSLLPPLAAFPSLPRLSPKRRRRQQILSPLCLPFHHTGRCLTSIVHFGQNCKRKIAAFGSKVNIWP